MNKYAYFKMMGLNKVAAEDTKTEEDKKNKKEQKAKNKAENQASKSERRRAGKWHSERLGGGTSILTSGLLGALIGGGIEKGMKIPALSDPGVGMPEGSMERGPILDEKGNQVYVGDRGWKGAAIGGAVGVLASLLAHSWGKGLAALAGPRTLKKQKDYNASVGQTLGNYFVPGMAGWNKTRTALTKDEQDAVLQELLLKTKLKDSGLA